MGLGALFAFSYSVFNKCIWDQINWESENFKVVLGDTLFGFLFGGFLNPYIARQSAILGMLLGLC
jgi:hypothetical protein